MLSYILENVNSGSTKLLEFTGTSGDKLRDALEGHPENPRPVNMSFDTRPVIEVSREKRR